MSIHESRNSYYYIAGVNTEPRTRVKGQETVEDWVAKGNKPEIVPMGVGSKFQNDLQKAAARSRAALKKREQSQPAKRG